MKGMNRLVFFLLFSFTGYFLIGHIFERSHFWFELLAFALCFIAYFIFNLKFKESVMILFFTGLIFRLIFIWGEPKLSDDYYRFIWDGKIMSAGENPYEKLPSDSKPQNGLQQNMHNELLFRMNSPSYYSVYPPIQQLFFVPTGFTESIPMALLVLRLEILIGEILLFIFLIKSVQSQFISLVSVSWIWLNPLWIIEVNGNLHFEGWLITFLAIGIYYLFKQKYWMASVFMGLSACLKMIPIIVVPSVKKWLGFNKAFYISIFAGIVFILSISWIFISHQQNHFFESIDLYYHKFEFNASFYFLLREIGFYFGDTHPIVYAGYIFMPIFAFIYCLIIFKKDEKTPIHFFTSAAFILTSYYLVATTVHPWYILTVLFFSVLSGKWYGIVWSGLVFLSYSAYSNNENLYYSMITLEYLLLFTFMFLEYKKDKSKLHPTNV